MVPRVLRGPIRGLFTRFTQPLVQDLWTSDTYSEHRGLKPPGGKRGVMSKERLTPWGGREKGLITGAAAGDQAAWDELVTRYAQVVWNVARGYCLDPLTAAEVSTLTWLRCAHHLEELVGVGDLAGWLSGVAAVEARRAAFSSHPGSVPVP